MGWAVRIGILLVCSVSSSCIFATQFFHPAHPPVSLPLPPQVHRSRFGLACQVCRQAHGACTQCCEPRCYASFHPLCAREAGYKMEVRCGEGGVG